MKLTARQVDVLNVLADADRELSTLGGLMAWQVRDRIYPVDSPMRRHRTAGRGASSHNGSVGATGNLAAGRILNALERKGLAAQPGAFRDNYRWSITRAGHAALAEVNAG